jgi:hypothetical protein
LGECKPRTKGPLILSFTPKNLPSLWTIYKHKFKAQLELYKLVSELWG